MNFVYPGFLFALFAVAIPILIHLFNFRKYKKVYFSNVQFLKDVEQKTSSKRNLKELLILLSRILAIVFLVLAFAKPYIPAPQADAAAGVSQVVSIFIDNSYSMEAVNKNGTLLDEAKRRAKEIVSAYGLNDRFQLLTNDFEGRHQRLVNRDEFLALLNDIRVSAATHTLKQIVQRQQDFLKTGTKSRKALYVLSDFQTNMLSPEPLKPDSSVQVNLVKIEANSLPNLSVDSVWFASAVHKPGDKEQLIIRLHNNSDKEAEQVPVKVLINKVQKAIASISIAPRSIRQDTLTFSGLREGWQDGEVALTDYPITFDDHFYFSFYVRPLLSVLAIHNTIPSPYLQAVYRSDAFFKLTDVNAGNIDYASLPAYPLIILDGLQSIPSGLVQQLQNYVAEGGSLFVFPSLTGNMDELRTLLQSMGADIPQQVVNQPAKVSAIAVKNSLFEDVFETVPKNLDLPAASSYLTYTNRSQTNRQELMTFAGHQPFLCRYTWKSGSVYLAAVPLDDKASNFVRHSLFVPVMLRAALTAVHAKRLSYTIGVDEILETEKVRLDANQTLHLVKKDFEAIPDLRQTDAGTQLFIADQVKEPGIYSLTKQDSVLAKFAFNTSRLESDMRYAGNTELKSQFIQTRPEVIDPASTSLKNQIKAASIGTQLWKVCLILALICLAIEILLIKFFRVSGPKPIEQSP
ncbi:hypothetical protein FW774_08335 [Pedobacter sp. BS3]|uniref:BatA domain-containing protein n=1 Tax=Pedobacter sp. BS3 TaxID=2567937 RepID=UPI0011EDA2C3|nr:BatA domain-containing protein [Pedobacter sp. BS3]TZF84964.1 hypothetical protein FW774_08335 [Pedobacter sp. BS3]